MHIFEWGEHRTIPDVFRRVGRKTKKTLVGRPPLPTLDLVDHIKAVAPENTSLDLEVRETLSAHPSVSEDLQCHLCKLILDRPLQLTTLYVHVVRHTLSTAAL